MTFPSSSPFVITHKSQQRAQTFTRDRQSQRQTLLNGADTRTAGCVDLRRFSRFVNQVV